MARSKRIQRHYLHKESVFTVFCQKRFEKFLAEIFDSKIILG